jgi:hypothetical protein
MTESSVGISAIAHYNTIDMDGALLLAEDIEWCDHKNGKVSYSERNGTGVLYYKHS